MQEEVDYLIVGQGLGGTFLSRALLNAGCSIRVFDAPSPFSSTKVASGVINPVTGRRLVRTWEIETLMPFAVNAYSAIGNEINQPLIRQCNIIDFHPTAQMQLAFEERIPEEKEYLRIPQQLEQWRKFFEYPFGLGETNPCWLIDLHAMLKGWRRLLAERQCLQEEWLDVSQVVLEGIAVTYKGYKAKAVIFCDGVQGFTNPWFQLLPYARNKGEALIVQIPDLPRNYIYKQGINIIPWRGPDLFWIGSSYEWDFADTLPSVHFRQKTETQLQRWLKLPYTIVDHLAAERPANLERRPFVGLHPLHPQIGILNGFGTKGCTLAPYFAQQLCDYLIQEKPIHPQADLRRFTRILSR
jgi:glycine/D-amino acid oxidase-like deaminating enzyme